jgi:ferric-dicitrate binding protein FerR (iron transport regulator)
VTTLDQAELLRRWIAGELDEASTGRLAEGLADAANRQQVCDDLRFDYALYEALTVERAQRRFAQRRTIMSWLPRTAAAAAVLLLGLYLGRSWWQPSPVGTVTAGTGAAAVIHHGQSRPLSVGVLLQGGDVVHAEPGARIAMTLADGSEMALEGPGECSIQASSTGIQCDLPAGALEVAASHQPRGRQLSITTRQAVASIIGTRFRLVGGEERTSLTVFEGVVGIRRRTDDVALRVAAWQRAEVATGLPVRVETAYAPPITITAGGVYHGAWASADPEHAAVTVLTAEPVVIEGCWLRGSGTMIQAARGARLTVRGCRIEGVRPQAAGRIEGRCIDAQEPASIVIERNDIRGTTGIRVHGPSPGEAMPVIVRQNRVGNLDGRPGDGRGGWLAGDEDSEAGFVQLDGMRGIRGADISWNEVVNEPGRSLVSHLILITGTSGSAEHPITIHDNLLSGAYPADPAKGRFGGGGVCIGFGGGATLALAPGWVRVVDNQVIATVNAAIAVLGGHDIEVSGNRAVSSGTLPDGQRISAQNTAFVVWDMARDRLRTPPTFFHNTVHDNLAGWMQWTSANASKLVDYWFSADRPGDRQADAGSTGNRELPYPVTRDDEQAEWKRWLQKAHDQGPAIGAAGDSTTIQDPTAPPTLTR